MRILRVSKLWSSLFAFLIVCCAFCRANVALLVQDPIGPVGFFSNAGHSAVWISDACLEADRTIHVCNTGDGLVLSSFAGWEAYGFAAIPARMYLYGETLDGSDSVPYGDTKVEARERFWSDHLAAIYPLVRTQRGTSMIGGAFLRRVYVLKVETTPEEDAAVLATLQDVPKMRHFHIWTNNCTDFSRSVLELYFPHQFRRQWLHNFALTTPQSLGDRMVRFAHKHPERNLTVVRLDFNHDRFLTSRRTHDVTGGLLFDWKYAVPIALVSPVAYASLGLLHIYDDGLHLGGSFRRLARPESAEATNLIVAPKPTQPPDPLGQ